MKRKKITSKNCLEIYRNTEISGDTPGQSKCWKVIYEFCLQKGMKFNNTTGIEAVITFLENNIKTVKK